MFMIMHVSTANRIQKGSIYTYFLRLYVNNFNPKPLVQILFILNNIFNMHNNTKENSLLNDIFVVHRLPLDLILFCSMHYGQYRCRAVSVCP